MGKNIGKECIDSQGLNIWWDLSIWRVTLKEGVLPNPALLSPA